MLRARTLQERGNSYVCAFCRHKLPAREERLRNRPFSTTTSSVATPRASGRALCSLSQLWGTRALSTSSALRGPNDSKPKPGGFPGGGFGGGLGGFGGFGAQNTVPKSTPSPSSSLLPHEVEARQRMDLAPKKAATSTGARDSKTPDKSNKQRGKGKGKQRENKGPRQQPQQQQQQQQQRQQQQPLMQKQPQQPTPLSSTLLAEAFKTDRSPKPVATPSSWSSPQQPATSQSKSDSSKGQASWGAFSARRVDTEVPTQSRIRATSIAPPTQKAPVGAPTSGEAVWGTLKRKARSQAQKDRDQKKNLESDDFWDTLQNRATNYKGERKAQSASRTSGSAAPVISDPLDSFDLSGSRSTEQGTRRKSRFELEEEESSRQGKKDKKRQRGRRQEAEEEWDDEQVSKWEQRQRRKADKEAKKLAGEQQAAPTIFLPEYISVSNLARGVKVHVDHFLRDLEQMGFEDLTGDTIMTGETAALVVMEYGFEPTVDTGSQRDLRPAPPAEDPSLLPARPPVVTIMGHVDHGKTTLLDWLRKSSIAAQEHGGITQHIGAFVVQMSTGKQITFLDTPGHAAFLSMRQRGANVTDIVVLVVAADDSVMPQTIEALKHARAAKVPIIVAINKIDKEDARVDQVKADLARNGVEIEDYGGDVQVVPVSGKTGKGMEDLEENIVTLSEILDVRAEPDGMAEGWILESSVKQTGKVASILVKRGTLRLGDYIVAGKTWAKIRGLRNEAGVSVREAPPGTPVQVLGWRDLPEAGEQVLQSPDEDKAKTAVEYRQEMSDREESSIQLAQQEQRQREKAAAEEAAAAAEAEGTEAPTEPTEPGIIVQNFVIKADVAGSVEAVVGTVQEIGSNEVQAKVLRSEVGLISEYDVDHASASNSVIVNFNNPILPHIRQRAADGKVRIIDHSVIYHVVDEVKDALSDLLPSTISHKVLGEADILQIFPINIKGSKYKNIAGCKVRNGSIKRTSMVKVLRKGEVVYDGKSSSLPFQNPIINPFLGKIDTLKHVKKDVMEMGKGTECGIGLDGFQDIQVDDQIQTYEQIKEKRTL
ncbi:Fc.00g013620.m01.CDS01 [Cosmosporella sp. VM-42]